MPSVQHFHNGADLEVRWRTSSEQTFSISTEDDISLTRSSITCGQELRTCKAYFTKLNPEVIQNVKVANDNTAVSVLVQADLGKGMEDIRGVGICSNDKRQEMQ